MNPIGIRDEVQTDCGKPWSGGRRTTRLPGHGGAGPSGTRVRGSRWPGWRSSTGRSCGRRAPPGSGSRSASGTTRSHPTATCAVPGTRSAPSCAPPRADSRAGGGHAAISGRRAIAPATRVQAIVACSPSPTDRRLPPGPKRSPLIPRSKDPRPATDVEGTHALLRAWHCRSVAQLVFLS